jgi:hypothetical protein
VSDPTNSQPAWDAALVELIGAGSDLADLIGIAWTSVSRAERLEKIERWQRAVLQVATLNLQRSNEATE